MATTTAKRRRRTDSPKKSPKETRLQTALDCALEELKVVHAFLSKVQTHSDVVTEAKRQRSELKESEFQLKEQLQEVRSDIRAVEQIIESSNDGMLAIIEPGPAEFMPLFDRMEKADPKTHGVNSKEWREKPISLLRLSPVASGLLIKCDILFIGQLQDRILDSPEWWKEIGGLTEPIAAAIGDKLSDFVSKGGAQ